MILTVVLLGSLLFRPSTANSDDSNEVQRFHTAVKFWTETLCTLQKTKTMVFHGIFTNGTRTLREFFEALLRTTNKYCNTVILLKTHTSSVPEETTMGLKRNDQNKLTAEEEQLLVDEDELIAKQVKLIGEETKKITRYGMFGQSLDVDRREWNIKRNWRKYDEYYFDIWNINIIFLGDNDAFEKLLNTSMALNSREHFIVFAVWNDDLAMLSDSRQMIDRTLRKLWSEQRVLNVLFNEPLSNRGFNLYTYNPFARNNEKSWGLLESVETTSQRDILRLLSTLCNRRTMNFGGYKLNVSIFDQGLEGMKIRGKIDPNSSYNYSGGYNWSSGILLGVVARRANFTVNVVEPVDNEMYGYRTRNGSYTGAIGDLIHGRAMVSFAFFFVKSYGKDNGGMEFTSTVGFDEVCVITPKAAKIPKGLRMYRIFKWSVWLCIMISHAFVYLTWYYAQLFESRSPKFKKMDGSKMAFRTLLIASGYSIPLPTTTSERCLLLGVFISSITIIGIFNGVLYTMFANDMRYDDIDTLEELAESGLPIGCTWNTIDVFGTNDDIHLNPTLKRLQKKLIRARHTIETAAIYRNMSGLLRKQHYQLISGPLKDKKGVRLVHRMKECPAKFHLACVLPKNSFLRERINTIITRLCQAGLPRLWRTRSILEHGLKLKLNMKEDHNRKNDDFEALQLHDLQVCFVILAVGLLSSIVVFCNEMNWLRLGCKKIYR